MPQRYLSKHPETEAASAAKHSSICASTCRLIPRSAPALGPGTYDPEDYKGEEWELHLAPRHLQTTAKCRRAGLRHGRPAWRRVLSDALLQHMGRRRLPEALLGPGLTSHRGLHG